MAATVRAKAQKEPRAKKNTPRNPKDARRAVASTPADESIEGELDVDDDDEAASGDSVTMAGTDDDPNQTYIEGVEPERDVAIEDIMGKLIDLDADAAEIRTQRKTKRGELTELMRKGKLNAYRFRGKIAKYKPGTDSVQIAEAPEK